MMDDEELQRIYQWVDEIPLSRPKRNIARDFSDGVLMAEIVAHYFPKLVEMHNYPAANSYTQKMYNWNTLNLKVFKRLSFQLSKDELDALCNCQPQAVERTLKKIQMHMARYGARKSSGANDSGSRGSDDSPSSAPRVESARAAPTSRGASSVSRQAPTSALRAHGEPRLDTLGSHERSVQELLGEKDETIRELRETVDILEVKIQKLEQLVRLKDSKIATLQAKLQQTDPLR
mmetsp:Transcript_27967/g.69476  ORF Transcript_27967/g.69476 Transcript_27967/m.69476 type:complete len:233 (-) Transcript_27967:491-1189(-)